MSKNKIDRSKGFTPEERRIRSRLIEMGIRQIDVAKALGITKQDVSKVVSGVSRSPSYIAEVYKYIGLDREAANG